MARYDVYRRQGKPGLLLDCQADTLDELGTRFAVPLVLVGAETERASRLHPTFEVNDTSYVMVTHLAAAVPTHAMGTRVGSLAADHSAIMGAFDMLLTGY